MENNILTPDSEVAKSPLHTVTPQSKYLAMALFVILPFVGGWIGYKYAPEKIVEVEKVVLIEQGEGTNLVNEKADTQVNDNSSTYTDQDFNFSFNFPVTWNAQVIDEDYGLYLPQKGLRHILVTKGEREQGLIISLTETGNLSSFFGCYDYKYNNSLKKWVRQDETKTNKCIDEENVKSSVNLTLDANYIVGKTPSLKTSGSNPTNVLIPFSDSNGFNVTYINWQGETVLGEIPSEAKTVIDSLKFIIR
jgi:hypothetical protein